MNNNKWLSSGRYGITRGLYKRLWEPKPSLSVVMVPPVSKTSSGGGPSEIFLLAESEEELLTEDGVELVVVELDRIVLESFLYFIE